MQENNNIDHRQRLVIRMSRNSLSFATVSEDNGQFTFEPYSLNSGISMAANLREAFRTQPILQQTYSHVLVMVDTPILMVPIESGERPADTLSSFLSGP